MKIQTNIVGNYSINKVAVKSNPNIVNKDFNTTATISSKEKEFFTKLYPAQRDEIINYHFYSKSGEMSGVAVGKNLDRRM